PALGPPGGGRIPAQPHHRVARLPGTGRRGARGKTQGTRDVRDRRGIEEAARQRAGTFPYRGMAAGHRTHPAPGPGCRRTAQECQGRHPMNAVVTASGLRKAYKNTVALDGADFEIPAGRIVGLIGPNGAGKTTALKAILGLVPFEGQLDVLGRDPRTQRDELMNDVCFIADVAVLPRWIRVGEAIDFVAGVHPRFDRARCQRFLANTQLKPNMRVRELSKGMIVQLHLALVMAIDARLLVLDEPTLGLDILYRKQFYQRLLEDYFDEDKTILITTHQVEE